MQAPSRLCARAAFGFFLGLAPAFPAVGQGSAPPPAAAFFSNPLLEYVELSPSGRYLAAVSGAPGRRDKLMLVDLQENKAQLAAGNDDVDILQFEWVNDNRLVFNVRDKRAGLAGSNIRHGLFAVNRDGTGLLQLASLQGKGGEERTQTGRPMLPWHTYLLGQRGSQDSDDIYVLSVDFNVDEGMRNADLRRLNTVTGQMQPVQRPGLVDSWLLDNAGEPRLAMHSSSSKASIHYLDPATGKWRVLTEYAPQAGGKNAIVPVGFGADGTLYVRSHAGKDTMALYTLDLVTGKLGPQPVVVLPGYDFNGKLVTRRGKLLGVSVETDAHANIWFDKDMEALQQRVDTLLPGTVNLLSVAARAGAPWVVVRSFSDTQPPVYRLFHPATGKMNPVGNSREGIEPAAMGRQDPLRYKARDGREIPALLTLPAGGARKNLPLVMLVHGGPYRRGNHWGWNPEVQFLASRGYAVLSPDFRGSTGYGQAHFQAGWKQWGLAMQDDVADGARWAIAQGIADPQRICIAGASYGGYSALMGLARDPGLYKCGIAWSAISDTRLLYKGGWDFVSDSLDDPKAHGVEQLLGDPERDAIQLKATSPREQAARITQPLLLAHGVEDRYVPFYEAAGLRDMLAKTNKQVEWIEYPDEVHGWLLEKNKVDFWGRVERFLGRHIGAGSVKQ